MDQRLIGNRRGATLSFRSVAWPALAMLSLALNVYLLFFRLPALEERAALAPAEQEALAEGDLAEGDLAEGDLNEDVLTHGAAGEGEVASADAAQGGDAEPAVAGAPAGAKAAKGQDAQDAWAGYELLSLKVQGSIARTFSEALGSEDGDVVSAFYSRIFMWKLDLKSDVRAGDRLILLYRILPDRQVEIAAASYESEKHRKTYRAYRFHQDGRPYPHFYDEDGVEVAERLVNSPLEDYEQVTSLLKDRPTHKGIDFKTPVGTPVLAPHGARVSRVNWGSFKYNGNCVELNFDNGNIAKFLHLEELPDETKPGRRLKAGEAFAASGNTGRSTAPHLHYQVETSSDRVVDPFTKEKTTHLKIGAAEKAKYQTLMGDLDRRLASGA